MESRLLFPSYGYQWPWGALGPVLWLMGGGLGSLAPWPLFHSFLPLMRLLQVQWGNTPHLQSNSILMFTPLSGLGQKDLVQGVEPTEMWVGCLLSYSPPTTILCPQPRHAFLNGLISLSFFFSFIFISWRLITLQYCSVFCHTLTWISYGFTCIPHPIPPPASLSTRSLWVFPVHQVRALVSCT